MCISSCYNELILEVGYSLAQEVEVQAHMSTFLYGFGFSDN
jgi:hypothetical protein